MGGVENRIEHDASGRQRSWGSELWGNLFTSLGLWHF